MLRRWINLTILRDFVMNQQPLSMSTHFKRKKKNSPAPIVPTATFAQIENDLSSLDAQYQNYLDRQNYGLTGMNNSFYP
jgi:hypothetical protein